MTLAHASDCRLSGKKSTRKSCDHRYIYIYIYCKYFQSFIGNLGLPCILVKCIGRDHYIHSSHICLTRKHKIKTDGYVVLKYETVAIQVG